jgi:hypothetical protein
MEPSAGRRSYGSNAAANRVPCGLLTFVLDPGRYGVSKNRKCWTEGGGVSLGAILSEVAKFICDYFVAAHKRREAEAIEQEKRRVESEIRWERHREEMALKEQEEAKRRHFKSIEAALQNRKDDLVKAAEWWRLHQSVTDFIGECERRWLQAQADGLTLDQQHWLTWAKETVKEQSPFGSGYPDPLVDGAFHAEMIPFGGPYPGTRDFPTPPTMPIMPAPVVIQQGYGSLNDEPPAPKPFPFWLRQRRS